MTASQREIDEAAIAWFARLRDDAAGEDAWLEFRDWIEADPRHLESYGGVEAMWLDLDEAKSWPPMVEAAAQPKRPPPVALPWRLAAAIAVGVLVSGGAVIGYLGVREPPPQVFAASADMPLEVTLEDGSHIVLDRGSRLEVALRRESRRAELVSGEASFDVAHEANRPFVVAAGDRSVRVLGTAFDVLRQDGRLRVTVSRGVVAVEPSEGGGANVRLVAGDQFEADAGEPPVTRRVDPEQVGSWSRGLLVYRDAPLQEVVADVGRYTGLRIVLAPSARAMTFSGVLKIDDGRRMLDRLAAYLALDTEPRAGGLVLSRAEAVSPKP